MSNSQVKRKCSAVRKDGQPCQAWAMKTSEPPMCPAHAGVQRAVNGERWTVGSEGLAAKDTGAIAGGLNEEGHWTRRGKRFYAMTVYRILERVGTA